MNDKDLWGNNINETLNEIKKKADEYIISYVQQIANPCFCTGACKNGGTCAANPFPIKPGEYRYVPLNPFPVQPMQGWQCPFCKTVYPPFTGSCSCQAKFTITRGITGEIQ
jgi:hypothetical protein